MLIIFFVCIAMGAVLAWRNWRWGILAAVAIGLLQDPVRKLSPGTPAYLTLSSLPVWLSCAVAMLAEKRGWIHHFLCDFPVLAKWLSIFGFYLIVPAGLSATYGRNSWQITLLGGFVYTTTFMLVIAGWALSNRRLALQNLLVFYVFCGAILLIGGPLEYLGWADKWKVIGTEALGHIWITNRMGGTMYMLSGLFRSPDIMGWHAAMVLMFSAILALKSRGKDRWLWSLLGIWAFVSIWVCGRRKMLSMIPVFFGTYLFLLFRFRSSRRIWSLVGVLLFVLGLGWHIVNTYAHDEKVEAFYMTTLGEWDQRVVDHGYHAVVTTIKQAGFWGYGLGMSQQGVHNINAEKPKLWQESGPSKLVAELGVPGAVLFLVVGFMFFRTAFEVTRVNGDSERGYLFAGLFSVMIANLASSVVSAQIYGDPFVILFLALTMGMVLSGSRIETQE